MRLVACAGEIRCHVSLPGTSQVVAALILLSAVDAAFADANIVTPVASTQEVRAVGDADAPAGMISLYNPNYLIVGPENSPVAGSVTTKFQLSLKFDVGADWYLSYTQRIFWDVKRSSEPILDMSIQPELFYVWRLKPDVADRLNLTTVQTGFEHESNGKDGPTSRSWNRLYVEPHFRWGGVFLEPRVWAILDKDEENGDIADYYGYFDLRFGYETESQQRFTVTARRGSKEGSAQLDISLPLQSFFPRNGMRPWLYAQAWVGTGETLLYYNVYTTAFRIGIEFRS